MRLDWRAIGLGALVAMAISVPLAIVSQVISDYGDGDGAGIVVLFYFVVLAGLAVGGFVAGSRRPEAPLTHGILAAVVAYVVVQGIGLIVNLARGDDVSIVALVFNAGLAAAMGLLGGWLANWRATSPAAE
ncbi:MAG: TIGR04086 family membrane protein [Acidimicrobiales bacterium]